MNKIIASVLLFLFANSCAPYDCTIIDTTPCGTAREQVERLVEKLIDHPDDLRCILENERCIDCSKILIWMQTRNLEERYKDRLHFFNKYYSLKLLYGINTDSTFADYDKDNTVLSCWVNQPIKILEGSDGSFKQLSFLFYLKENGKIEMFKIY